MGICIPLISRWFTKWQSRQRFTYCVHKSWIIFHPNPTMHAVRDEKNRCLARWQKCDTFSTYGSEPVTFLSSVHTGLQEVPRGAFTCWGGETLELSPEGPTYFPLPPPDITASVIGFLTFWYCVVVGIMIEHYIYWQILYCTILSHFLTSQHYLKHPVPPKKPWWSINVTLLFCDKSRHGQ